jgi:UPF0755 protein
LEAGHYDLSTGMSTGEIVTALASGQARMSKVTFPEGYDLEEMGALLQQEQVCSKPDFLGAASNDLATEVLGWPVPERAGTAEGYCFPETYYFLRGEDAETVVRALLEQMKLRFIAPEWGPAARAKPWGSLPQVVTLASIVEKEAKLDRERPLIAGVLVARLRRNMLLQADATVQYALGEHKARLTFEDLKVPSPYNTYLYRGFPPGPICNPGLPSLKAALHPQVTDYLFYVAKPDGSHVFSRTYEEHKAAIKAIRGSG